MEPLGSVFRNRSRLFSLVILRLLLLLWLDVLSKPELPAPLELLLPLWALRLDPLPKPSPCRRFKPFAPFSARPAVG